MIRPLNGGALAIILPPVLELSHTAHDLQPCYADVAAENPAWAPRTGTERGQPWRWNPERRALLRAELDAIYAGLYGLSRDELRYILDPADVMGVDYLSETFRVLKDKETRLYGEYRTRRLVLAKTDGNATVRDAIARVNTVRKLVNQKFVVREHDGHRLELRVVQLRRPPKVAATA